MIVGRTPHFSQVCANAYSDEHRWLGQIGLREPVLRLGLAGFGGIKDSRKSRPSFSSSSRAAEIDLLAIDREFFV